MSAIKAENAVVPPSHSDLDETNSTNRANSPHFDTDDSDVEDSLDEDFFTQPSHDPAELPSPHPAQDAQTDLSSSWLSISDLGTSTSGFPPSDDPEVEDAAHRPDSPEGVSLRLSSSWIDAEAKTSSEPLSLSVTHGPNDEPSGNDKEDRHEAVGSLRDGPAGVDTEMSSIDKVMAWKKPTDIPTKVDQHESDQHNADLIFPILSLDASMQGTESCDTIKNTNKTRFNRSASESTVKLMSGTNINRGTDAHHSFLADLTDAERGSEYSLGFDLEGFSDQPDLESASASGEGDEWDLGQIERELQVGRVSGAGEPVGHRGRSSLRRRIHRYREGGPAREVDADEQSITSLDLPSYCAETYQSKKQRDQALAKYWMEEVGKQAIVQPEARAWVDALAANRLAEENVNKRRRNDRLKGIAFLVLPFIALGIVALLTSPSIGAMLSTTPSRVRDHGSDSVKVVPEETLTRRSATAEIIEVVTYSRSEEVHSMHEATSCIGAGRTTTLAEDRFSIETSAIAIHYASRRDNVNTAAIPFMDRFKRLVPAELIQSSVATAQWSREQLHKSIYAAKQTIHRASVALIGTLAMVPKGIARARARISHWIAPAWERTTALVMVDGRAAYRSMLMDALQNAERYRASLSVVRAHAVGHMKRSKMAALKSVSDMTHRVIDTRAKVQRRAAYAFTWMRESSVSASKQVKASRIRSSDLISKKAGIVSQALRIRMSRYRDSVKAGSQRLRHRHRGKETLPKPGATRPRQRRANRSVLHRKQKRAGSVVLE